jgi:hypothetical protein
LQTLAGRYQMIDIYFAEAGTRPVGIVGFRGLTHLSHAGGTHRGF